MEAILILIIIGVISTLYQLSQKKHVIGQTPNPGHQREIQETYTKRKAELKRNLAVPDKQSMVKSQKISNQNKQSETSFPLESETIRKEAVTIKNEQIYSVDNLESQKLIDAIIWSEILGEPRSKRPYSTKRY